jgi:hypothetical protein
LLSANYDYETFLDEKTKDSILITVIDAQGEIKFYPIDESVQPQPGDTVISFGPKIAKDDTLKK